MTVVPANHHLAPPRLLQHVDHLLLEHWVHGLHGHGGHLHDDHDTGAEEEALVRRSASGVFRYSEESGFSNEPPFLHDHNKEGDYDESTNTYDGYPKDPFSG